MALVAGTGGSQGFAQLDKEAAVSALPHWAVLVLQPVSIDRVRPVTGVVISSSGLVIVPLDFAGPGDQIIILDGGTDIVANGRAATVQQQLPNAGLTVLSAPGLKRQPARLSSVPLENDETIHLAAFPPAEMISEGAAPLWVPTQVKLSGPSADSGFEPPATTRIATTNPLPNVTGPLLDECGNLVGFSSADGVQSMETSRSPTYLWKGGLLAALGELAVSLAEAPCPVAAAPTAESLAAPGEVEKSAEPEAPASSPIPDEPIPNTPVRVEPLPGAGQPAAVTGNLRWLPWLATIGILMMAGLAWWWFRRQATADQALDSLLTGSGARNSRALPVRQQEPSRADCVLEIRGQLSNGQPFQVSCEVNSAAIDVVIGRGAVDLRIDTEGIQREHARLSGSSDLLTFTALGASRSTWINRVSCLKGEIMYVGEQDTIFLGEVSFRITIRPLGS